MRLLAALLALAVVGCDLPGSSDMPNLEDPAEFKAAVLTLDPIAPGSRSNDHAGYGLGNRVPTVTALSSG